MNKHSNDFEKFLSGCWRVAKVLAAYYINLNICIQSLLYTYCTPQTHPNTWNARPTMVKLRILRSYSTFPLLQVAFGVSNSMIFCQWQLRQQQDSPNMPQKIVHHKHLELCYHRCSVFLFWNGTSGNSNLHCVKGQAKTGQLVLASHRPGSTGGNHEDERTTPFLVIGTMATTRRSDYISY